MPTYIIFIGLMWINWARRGHSILEWVLRLDGDGNNSEEGEKKIKETVKKDKREEREKIQAQKINKSHEERNTT